MICLEPIIAAAENAIKREDGDFEKDGLLYCGKCGTRKQRPLDVQGRSRNVMCLCRCAHEEHLRKEKAWQQEQRRIYIANLRSEGLQDRAIHSMRFEHDDGADPESIDKARRYVTAWERMRKDNVGLLLWGNTGNGKTFAAGCIANAVIDLGYPVLMTSFPRILSAVNGMFNEDKMAYMDSFRNYELLVIDDLGAERQSEYALEQVYNVIDSRYKTKKPLIVTTNLPLGEMQKAKNMDYQRIYDRVLEMCVPIHYRGESRRKDIAATKREAMATILGAGR